MSSEPVKIVRQKSQVLIVSNEQPCDSLVTEVSRTVFSSPYQQLDVVVWLAVLAYHLSESVVSQTELPTKKVDWSLTCLIMLNDSLLFGKLVPLVERRSQDNPMTV